MDNRKNRFKNISIGIPTTIPNISFTESEVSEYGLFCTNCGEMNIRLIECSCCGHIVCVKCIKDGKCDLCNSN